MLEEIKKGLIVSCQALMDEPLHGSHIMARMAMAAAQAGAVGIRAQGIEDIHAIEKAVTLPIIGIIKKNYVNSDVFITPTLVEVEALLETSCAMIAVDATQRLRPDGVTLQQLLERIHQGGRFAMADCSTLEEAILAEKMGFDCVSTTLAGYTPYSESHEGPDFELIQAMCNVIKIPVIAEGRIHSPQHLQRAMECGIHAAVVGGAITRPQEITARFVAVLE